jgi:hypothetical protein
VIRSLVEQAATRAPHSPELSASHLTLQSHRSSPSTIFVSSRSQSGSGFHRLAANWSVAAVHDDKNRSWRSIMVDQLKVFGTLILALYLFNLAPSRLSSMWFIIALVDLGGDCISWCHFGSPLCLPGLATYADLHLRDLALTHLGSLRGKQAIRHLGTTNPGLT